MRPLSEFRKLKSRFGVQQWWPITTAEGKRLSSPNPMTSRGAFEISVGAILTQNTAWTNVEKAIANLKSEKHFTPHAMHTLPLRSLARLIRPSGYYRQKARKLKEFVWWMSGCQPSFLQWIRTTPLRVARSKLLEIHGIGPETADSIILYAGGRPIFVIDAYTKRFCHCHGVQMQTYDDYQQYFQKRLPRSPKIYKEFHALIVCWGKENLPTKKNMRGC